MSHAVSLGIGFSLSSANCPFEFEMQSVTNQHFGHSRRVFFHFPTPTIDAVKGPLVGQIVDK